MADPDQNEQDQGQPGDQDVKQLQALYDLMQQESLENLELKDQDIRIRLDRARKLSAHEASHHRPSHPHSAHGSHPASESQAPLPAGHSVPTPLAGVFYRASSPTSVPYVQAGSVVDSGQTLCIVEAMKVMNEIKAEHRCKIIKILAENARPVTAGQALFEVEPA